VAGRINSFGMTTSILQRSAAAVFAPRFEEWSTNQAVPPGRPPAPIQAAPAARGGN
jgi:hypothetical protein